MAHAAPVVKDGFSFAGDSLFVEVSNMSRHRRATVPELRAILRPSDTADHKLEDPVGHWWEAQSLHYGLKPSKTKAVAKTRLLDALNKGTLAVPDHIAKLEAEMKKQWSKKEREAKAELGKSKSRTSTKTTTTATSSTTAGKKRKTGSDGNAAPSMPAKKSKSTAAKPKGPQSVASSVKAAANKPKPATKKKTPPEKSVATKSTRPKSKASTAKPSAPKATAKNSKLTTAQSSAPPSSPPRTKQTARKSAPSRANLPFLDDFYSDDHNSDQTDDSATSESPPDYESIMWDSGHSSSQNSSRLGLLNGRYEIDCPDLEQWDMYDGYPFSLILTLEGNSLWGTYDFGMFSGILHLPRRPYTVSDERYEFRWRGRENGEGEMSFGGGNVGWIEFLGNGVIGGMINCYGEAMFQGRRVSGGQARSERDARSMRDEWNSYNQREYDRENRGRWGGSGWY